MDKFLSTVLIGLISGAPFALLALGMVLVYKGSKVFNFAQGEFGTIAAFASYLLSFRLPVPVAMLFGVVVGVLMGLLTERLVVQPLFHAPKVTLLVATAAITGGSVALQLAIGDASLRTYPSLKAGNAFQTWAVAVKWQQLLLVAALVVVAVGLYLFFKTNLGLAVLAASQEPVATDLVGIGTRRMSALVWALAGFVGGLAGVITAALQPFTPGFMTAEFLAFAFVAAVVGGMTSMPGAILGSIVLGQVQAFSAAYLTEVQWVADNVPAPGELAVFALLLGVLAFRPTGLLGKEA
ncbi:MAG TPA: branched-chain amino acid ABC transporter permease [Acidimicrobiales bacterium]|nr:branched-chain amino acid ABC transporter permease [Acidimicrobiales bacterium]